MQLLRRDLERVRHEFRLEGDRHCPEDQDGERPGQPGGRAPAGLVARLVTREDAAVSDQRVDQIAAV